MVSKRGGRYKFSENERVLCYEPDPTKAAVLYDSKVLGLIESKDKLGRRTAEYLIHFQGWNSSWDRCVSEDFVLKDTEENRQLQRDLAETQMQLGAYPNRRERKKDSSTAAGSGAGKRARHGFSDDDSSSTQPDGTATSKSNMPKNQLSERHEKKFHCSHCDKQPQHHDNARNSKYQNKEKNMIYEDPEQCPTENDVHYLQPHQKEVHQNKFIASETSAYDNIALISKVDLQGSNNLGEHAEINNIKLKQLVILEDRTESHNLPNIDEMKAQKASDSQKPITVKKRNIFSIITTRRDTAALKSLEKVRSLSHKTTQTQEENEYEVRYKCRLCGEDFKEKTAALVHKTNKHSHIKRYKVIFQYIFLKKPAIHENFQQNKHDDDVAVPSQDDVTISLHDNILPQIVSESVYSQPEPKVRLALNRSNDAVDRANRCLQEDTIKTRQNEGKRAEIRNILDSKLIQNKETDKQIKRQRNSDDIECIKIPSSPIDECFDDDESYENYSLTSSIFTHNLKERKRKGEARDLNIDKIRTRVRSNDVSSNDDDDALKNTIKHNSWKKNDIRKDIDSSNKESSQLLNNHKTKAVDSANRHIDEHQEDTSETRQKEVKGTKIQNILDVKLTNNKESDEKIKKQKSTEDIECISITSSPIDKCFDINESSDTDADGLIRKIAFFLKKRKRNSLKRLLQLPKNRKDKMKRNCKEKIYKCKKCSIHFMDERKLRKHLYKQKHNDQTKHCVVCKLKFSKNYIKIHVKKHHMKMSLRLKDFDVITELSSSESSDTESSTTSTDDTDDYTRHLSQPQDSEPSTSKVNHTEQVENYENARNVLRTAENDLYIQKCGIKATCLPLLGKPDEKTEANSDVTKPIKLYKCEICDIYFIYHDTLRKHLSTGDHTIKTKKRCPKCDLNFTKLSFKKHILLHHNKNNNSIKFKIISDSNKLSYIDAQIKNKNEVLEEIAHKKIEQNTYKQKNKYAIASRIPNTISQTKANKNEVLKNEPQVALDRLTQEENNTNQPIIKNASSLLKTISKKYNLRSNSCSKTIYQCRICKVCFLTLAAILTHLHRKRHDMSAVESCSICHLSFHERVMDRHFKFHHKTLQLRNSSDFEVKILPRFKNIFQNLTEKSANNSQEEEVVYSTRRNIPFEENRNHTIHEDKGDERKKQIHSTFIKRQIQEQNELGQKCTQQTVKKQLENNIPKTPADTNHVDERLYKCSQCDVHYFKKQSLLSHMRLGRHDIKNRRPCPMCHYMFSSTSLKRHIFLQHLKLQIQKFTIVNAVNGDESTHESSSSNMVSNFKYKQLLKECVVVLTDSPSALVSSTSNDASKLEPRLQVESVPNGFEFSDEHGTLDVDIDRNTLISKKLYNNISASDIGHDTQISNIDSQPKNINAANMDKEVEIKELETKTDANNIIVPKSVSSVKILSNVLFQKPLTIEEQQPKGQNISVLNKCCDICMDAGCFA